VRTSVSLSPPDQAVMQTAKSIRWRVLTTSKLPRTTLGTGLARTGTNTGKRMNRAQKPGVFLLLIDGTVACSSRLL